MGPTDEEKIRNAETMYGSGSKQHEKAKKLFGSKPDGSNSRGGMSKAYWSRDDIGQFAEKD